MKKVVLLCATTILTLFSCGQRVEYKLKKLDITGANSLFIGKQKNASSKNEANDASGTLFKKDDNNYIQTVTYTWVDSSGKEISYVNTRQPTHLYNFNDTYMYLEFKGGVEPGVHNYLINTQTGDSHIFPDTVDIVSGSPFHNAYRGIKYWIDKNNNIYFVGSPSSGGRNKIYKINLDNPDDIELSAVSLNDAPFGSVYAVDDDGNCYYVATTPSPSNYTSYLITSEGLSCKIDEGVMHRFWRGYDNKIYDFTKNPADDDYWLTEWSIEDNPVRATSRYIKSVTWDDFCIEASCWFLFLNNKQKVYSFGYNEVEGDLILHLTEIYDGAKVGDERFTMNEIDLDDFEGISKIFDFRVSNDFIYILGENDSNNNVILKIDPDTNDVVSRINLDGEHKVIDEGMHVSKNNIITFETICLNDQSHVIATVDATVTSPEVIYSTTRFTDNLKSLILI